MFKIGNIHINGQVGLAPMAGVTDSAFRRLCKEYGAALISSELISVDAIERDSDKSLVLLHVDKQESPVSIQLFGSEIDKFVLAAQKVSDMCDIIDINLGCPAPKITCQGAGSSLLKEPQKVHDIVSAVVNAVPNPVTVKMRAGYDDKSINALEIAQLCEKAGASAIIMHPRTTSQKFSGHSNWEIIKQVKNAVRIPVIGNGDVKTPQDARRMLEETGCDMVMVGRAAMGNPYLFKQIDQFLKTGELLPQQSYADKLSEFKRYVEYANGLLPFSRIKQHAVSFTKGIKEGSRIREELMKANDIEAIMEIYNESLDRIMPAS